MPLLTKGGKFVVEGGKFVTTDDPAKCKCCKPPPPPDGWKCVDGQCLPSDDGPYKTLEECRAACCGELKSGTISGSIDGCGQIDTVETVTNDTGRDAWLKASGSVDDDVLIDGEVYQEGQFPFPWENYGSPCGSTNSTNGAHDWTFSKKLGPGQSVRFGIKNNGYGGGITGTWTLNSCEDPPPPGKGACCERRCGQMPVCHFETREWCDAIGGTFRGEGTTCADEWCEDVPESCDNGKTCNDCGGYKSCEPCEPLGGICGENTVDCVTDIWAKDGDGPWFLQSSGSSGAMCREECAFYDSGVNCSTTTDENGVEFQRCSQGFRYGTPCLGECPKPDGARNPLP
jgi:hypothetical protein